MNTPSLVLSAHPLKEHIFSALAEQTASRLAASSGLTPPHLAVLQVGDDFASNVYIRKKEEACAQLGFTSVRYRFESEVSQETIRACIQQCNQDASVSGILLQLPLPPHLNPEVLIESIDPSKDVDGLHPYHLGCLLRRHPKHRPCTSWGIRVLLEHYRVPLEGRHVLIVGASSTVGRPLALELTMAGATISLCHSRTPVDLIERLAGQADIIVSATGKSHPFNPDKAAPSAVIVDVGIHRNSHHAIEGDFPSQIWFERGIAHTPVPGGVGLMTVSMLMLNTFVAHFKENAETWLREHIFQT